MQQSCPLSLERTSRIYQLPGYFQQLAISKELKEATGLPARRFLQARKSGRSRRRYRDERYVEENLFVDDLPLTGVRLRA